MPDEKPPEQPKIDPALAQFIAQQGQFNQGVAQTLNELRQTLPKLVPQAQAPQAPAVRPGMPEYDKANEIAINEFVKDPVAFSGKLVGMGAQQGFERAKGYFDEKLTEVEARQRATQVYQAFFGTPENADLRHYEGWIAGEMGRMPAEWPVEHKLVQAAQFIRQSLSQRDEAIRTRGMQAPEWGASAAGGSPVGYDGAEGEAAVPMDELSMQRELAKQRSDWKAQRRKPAEHDSYQRRVSARR